jgi:hypothetical protein
MRHYRTKKTKNIRRYRAVKTKKTCAASRRGKRQ